MVGVREGGWGMKKQAEDHRNLNVILTAEIFYFGDQRSLTKCKQEGEGKVDL